MIPQYPKAAFPLDVASRAELCYTRPWNRPSGPNSFTCFAPVTVEGWGEAHIEDDTPPRCNPRPSALIQKSVSNVVASSRDSTQGMNQPIAATRWTRNQRTNRYR